MSSFIFDKELEKRIIEYIRGVNRLVGQHELAKELKCGEQKVLNVLVGSSMLHIKKVIPLENNNMCNEDTILYGIREESGILLLHKL